VERSGQIDCDDPLVSRFSLARKRLRSGHVHVAEEVVEMQPPELWDRQLRNRIRTGVRGPGDNQLARKTRML
jgi:hypothetical protein